MDRKLNINISYVMLVILAFIFIQRWWAESQSVETIAYSEFQQLLQNGRIEEISIYDQYIRGRLKNLTQDGRSFIYTVRVEPEFAEGLAKYDVVFTGVIESNFFSNLLSWVIPAVLFFAIWMFFIRKMASSSGMGGLMSVGKSKAKVYVEQDTKVTFEDVAGVDEAKEELVEIVAFLKDPQSYGRLGAHIPKGVLLVGPPGTGKTLLARAVAGEAAVPFYSINGSEFVEMFVGVGAARVRDLFDQARLHAPCIIFIDELDALGRARGAGPMSGGHDEKEQTLNQLLSELDGFDSQSGIVLLSATNRPEILDPALLRAGRFDRQILVDRPDKTGRIAILQVHVKNVTLASETDLEQVAALTPGFSGADLANLVNEATIMATRRGGDEVILEDFSLAIERIVAGLEKKNRILNPYERAIVAYHESGHALVTMALPGIDKIHKISIIPRGIGALGYNIQRPTEDRYLMTRDELLNKMAALLGGRAAELLAFDKLSTGAVDDLEKASNIARSMVTRYGMEDELGMVSYAPGEPLFLDATVAYGYREQTYSDETAHDIDRSVRRLIDQSFELATRILQQNRQLLDDTAARLLAKETLTEVDLTAPVWPVPAKQELVAAAQVEQ